MSQCVRRKTRSSVLTEALDGGPGFPMRPRGFRSRGVWDLSHEFNKPGPGYGKIVKQGIANRSWHR